MLQIKPTAGRGRRWGRIPLAITEEMKFSDFSFLRKCLENRWWVAKWQWETVKVQGRKTVRDLVWGGSNRNEDKGTGKS